MSMLFDIGEITLSLADSLDLVGVNRNYHGKRVAYLAVEIGKHVGWPEFAIHDLALAAILHDFGLSSSLEFGEFSRKDGEYPVSLGKKHAHKGWLLLNGFYPYSHLAPIVLHHHTPWRELQEIALADSIAGMMANCICLADFVEVSISHYPDLTILYHTWEISRKIEKMSGSMFDPELVKIFLKLARSDAFWLNLDPRYLVERLKPWLTQRHIMLDLPQVRQLAHLFAEVVDSKSAFTARHSLGVSQISRLLAKNLAVPSYTLDLLEIAGLLHDIGKLRIPDEILNKPGPLTQEEMSVIRRHTFDTYKILNGVQGFWGIAEWAAFHHEAPNGSGYPFGLADPLLCLEARIISTADIFQALAQHRPYRSAMPPEQIMTVMQEFVTQGKLSAVTVEIVQNNLEECHRLALQQESIPDP
ncbi:MAG: HD domain-containing protein [Magnetococcales bacterium]|nr:HD domain-containing protein [Magnetococcales bacterium]